VRFVSGNYTASSGDVQGAAAAGGDVALSSYTIGALLPNQAGGPALVAGGNLELNVGGDVYGDAVYGGTSTIAGSFTITGSTRRGTPLDFADAFTALDSLSQQLNDLGVNGAIAAQYGNLTLTGTDPTLNVFQLPATALSGQWGITLEVPAGSFALINVAGTSVALEQTIALNGLPSTSLLFNLPQATSLQIENTDLSASVLAPLAAITFSSGRMEGTLVGASMSGDGQTNLPLLNPCFPVAVRAAAAGR